MRYAADLRDGPFSDRNRRHDLQSRRPGERASEGRDLGQQQARLGHVGQALAAPPHGSPGPVIAYLARASSDRVTIPIAAVGIHASTVGFRSNTMTPLSISFWSRKKQIPSRKPISVRVPAPEERSEPSTNGIVSNTENTIATVRAIRDQKANA